ncbi:MAG: class I SAM-dependent methyltransferase [Desulfomonilaceae bacterium]
MWRRDTLKSRILRSLIPERIPWFAARLYDQIASSAIETYYKEVAKGVTGHTSHGLVLDVGTGPGYLPIEIAKRAPQITVVGIDSSKALVRIARQNAERQGLSDRVRFVKCDGNRLDFADDSYDLVISTGSLHAWKNPVLVINECFRVLKPGCEAWLLDPAHIITPEAQQVMGSGLKGVDRLANWWGAFTSKLTPPYTVREIEEIILQTKFKKGTVVEEKWLTVKLRKHASRAIQARQRPHDEVSGESHNSRNGSHQGPTFRS